jgi:hypothetical protein
MNALLNAVQLIKTHWKLLLVIFALGGTGAVATTVGLTPVAEFTGEKITDLRGDISPTTVE